MLEPPYNVLFIENSIGLSGSTVSLCTLLEGLDRSVYRPHVVLSRDEQRDYLHQHCVGVSDVTVIAPGKGLKEVPVGRQMSAMKLNGVKLIRRFCSWVTAILEMCCVTVPYAIRLYRYARSRNIHLIHHNNGFDVAALLLSRFTGLPIVAYQRGDEWNSFLVRFVSKWATKYIANSETTKKSLLSLGLEPSKIVTIYPGVTLNMNRTRVSSRVSKEEFGVSSTAPCFGVIGMLLPWKGQHVFLKAARIVFERIPSAHAFIVGGSAEGENDYRAELHEIARNLGIEDRVIFTGFRKDVPEIISLLDVVVHASVDPEPFGRVIAEAMMMEKPVIASDAGGPQEIIEPGRTGFLVTPGDHEQMADYIANLLEDKKLADCIAKEGAAEAKRRFCLDVHVEQVQHIYSEVLAKKQTSSAVSLGSSRGGCPNRLT